MVQTTTNRSPLHPNALTIEDIKPGTPVVAFMTGRHAIPVTITSIPAAYDGVDDLRFSVRHGDGVVSQWYAKDLGIVPFQDGTWHATNFMVLPEDEESAQAAAIEAEASEAQRRGMPPKHLQRSGTAMLWRH